MASPRNSQPPLSLLLVEDDREAVKVLKIMIPMKFPDVTIHIAANGTAGMELCKERSPDIVVTDINMPGMDGVRMAREIRTTRPGTKFIVITGYSDKAYLDQFSTIGITAYILKPIEFKELFSAIEKCIGEIRERQ
ncbi:MAG TPA: response regulator [Desulfuromonadaceae bacterium]